MSQFVKMQIIVLYLVFLNIGVPELWPSNSTTDRVLRFPFIDSDCSPGSMNTGKISDSRFIAGLIGQVYNVNKSLSFSSFSMQVFLPPVILCGKMCNLFIWFFRYHIMSDPIVICFGMIWKLDNKAGSLIQDTFYLNFSFM